MKMRSGDEGRFESEILMQKPPLGTPLDWENPLNKDLVLHLACNEGHGDKVQDISLNSNHGGLNNFAFPPTAASGWNPGQKGAALKFGVNDEHIIIPQSALQTSEFTLSFLEFTTGALGYFLCDSTDVTNLFLRRSIAGIGYVSGGVGDAVLASASLSHQTWHNHVLTHNPSGDVGWYVDGVLIQSAAGSNFIGLSSDLWIGNRPDLSRDCIGMVDQIRIQSRAWTAEEVVNYTINPWQVYLQP